MATILATASLARLMAASTVNTGGALTLPVAAGPAGGWASAQTGRTAEAKSAARARTRVLLMARSVVGVPGVLRPQHRRPARGIRRVLLAADDPPQDRPDQRQEQAEQNPQQLVVRGHVPLQNLDEGDQEDDELADPEHPRAAPERRDDREDPARRGVASRCPRLKRQSHHSFQHTSPLAMLPP